MSSTTASSTVLAYPAPTIVIGVGRLGLSVLEKLGEDWHILRQSGGDASLGNLRLLHVHPEGDDGETAWRQRERSTVELARYAGHGDLPSLALDLALLRSLGLVRFRDGSYQVAMPVDAGVAELYEEENEKQEEEGDVKSKDEKAQSERPRIFRRRYFLWQTLSPDPITAAERLRRLADQQDKLDLFLSPLLHRVRQGHSPRALFNCIARCGAFAQGRDPSPWSWLQILLKTDGNKPAEKRKLAAQSPPEGASPDSPHYLLRLHFGTRGASAHDSAAREFTYWLRKREPLLNNIAPEPMPEWNDTWRKRRPAGTIPITGGQTEEEDLEKVPCFDIHIPEPFRQLDEDMTSDLDPRLLLRDDWQASGWATGELGDAVTFSNIEASAFRHGFFDHDGTRRSELGGDPALRERLRELARLVHQGLARLWVDLQREKVEETTPSGERHRDYVDAALRQSLELLGGMIVYPTTHGSNGNCSEKQHDGGPSENSEQELLCRPPTLPPRQQPKPSALLHQLECPSESQKDIHQLLLDRLLALGIDVPGGRFHSTEPLFRQVQLQMEDLDPTGDDGDGTQPRQASPLNELRQVLNQQVRRLYSLSFLSTYRTRPLRRPPRLTVYVVGDMLEPFVRASFRVLLREVHAQLLRSFNSIFEYYREGFDRALSVTPILWMPHPADPFEGQYQEYSHCEEAAIIDTVQGIRRWVESVLPASRRRIAQIFINSRITETAVLSQHDAARQTRDFITFQIRNDISRDEWLRKTAIGTPGDDFFASFSCYEIDFPAEKSREYLANRLARELLLRLRSGRPEEKLLDDDTVAQKDAVLETELPGPKEEELLSKPASELRELTRSAGERLADSVRDKLSVEADTSRRQIAETFDKTFEDRQLQRIQDHWLQLTRRRGRMDESVDHLRRRTSMLLSRRLEEMRRRSDQLIEELSSRCGLDSLFAGFSLWGRQQRDRLEVSEQQRREQESLCMQHREPTTRHLRSLRQNILDAAERKPDLKPMQAGFAILAVLALILGGPLSQGLAFYFELHQEPGVLELILGKYGAFTGTLVLLAISAWGLRGFMRRAVRRIRESIEKLANATQRVVAGPDASGAAVSGLPSVCSFFLARLKLTAALAIRGFELRLTERMEGDRALARRLGRSLDIQSLELERRAEALGVRPQMSTEELTSQAALQVREDVRNLFDPLDGHRTDRLIEPATLLDFYQRYLGHEGEYDAQLPSFIERGSGFSEWRRTASLANTEALLGFGREQFQKLVAEPVLDQPQFTDEVAQRLLEFITRHYSNIGFGAKFAGSEGLDPDGVKLLAEAALVLHPQLHRLFQRVRHLEGMPATTRTMEVQRAGVRPNAAYMLSLAQGIRAHSVRNLKRFESFHDRVHMPDDRTFPMSDEAAQGSLHRLSLYTSTASKLQDLIEISPSEGGSSRKNGSKHRNIKDSE